MTKSIRTILWFGIGTMLALMMLSLFMMTELPGVGELLNLSSYLKLRFDLKSVQVHKNLLPQGYQYQVMFSPKNYLSKSNRENLMEKIAKCVVQHLPQYEYVQTILVICQQEQGSGCHRHVETTKKEFPLVSLKKPFFRDILKKNKKKNKQRKKSDKK